MNTLLCLALLLQAPQAPTTPAVPTGDALSRQAYLLNSNKYVAVPTVTVDSTQAPDLEEWGKNAATLMEQWYPIVWNLLGTEGSTPMKTMKVTFQKEQGPPAYATGGGIFVKADWVRAHPDDFGMMIHEMTHLVQSYPGDRKTPGWLVEGIADYIRWWRYEPEAWDAHPKITEKNNYTDAYRVTGYFLAYVVRKYDHKLIQKMDKAMKEKRYDDKLWEESTGKSVKDLWAEFVANRTK
ncbi:MAG: basic secretory protein-like protein [Armatimonas sp.]